ncbi:hypothetical protein Btru_030191 [Bulinus truncatus]|nr:hypothetical protein Btru_030191 [Bulinus truncatus]
MDDDVLVIAVRLCDIDEKEQPDPLCLRFEELATWRHFESLLCDMFKSPPHAVKVSYLDDESDWVELSSDAELKEAVTLTKSSGEILQLRVKRLDDEKLIKLETAASSFENTSVLKPIGSSPVYYVPTTDPGGDVFGKLEYPHPPANKLESDRALPACFPTAPYMAEPQVLVYPHPKDSSSVAYVKNSGLPLHLFQNSVGDGLKDIPSVKSEDQESTFIIPWDKAKGLTTEKKMFYLKAMMASGGSPSSEHEIKPQDNAKVSNDGLLLADLPSPHAVIVEPLCAQPGSLGQNFIPNQDPFELEGESASQEGIQGFLPRMCSPTLVPTSALMEPGYRQDKTLTKETEGGTSSVAPPVKLIDWVSAVHSAMSFNPATPSPPAAGAPPYSAAIPKCKLVKKGSEKSCTMKILPGNLLMMVGAQSGANAVAIEMPPEPEFFNHSVNKDEEIAASGGASSTSASEETGEVLTRAGSDAAAVSREMKAFTQPAVSFDIPQATSQDLAHKLEKSSKRSEMKTKLSSSKKDKPASEKKDKHHTEKKEKHCEKKEKSADKKDSSGSGVKVKCDKVKSGESKKKASESAHKESRKKSEDKKVVTEDVESGEKVRVKAEPVFKVKTFMKLLEQMKQDMHQNIVRDVAKQTDSLLQALINSQKIPAVMEPKLNNDQVIHVDIYCDNCNDEIRGIRFKCGNCLDFDLCEVCEDLPDIHDPSHVFLKLRYPARNTGRVGNEKAPLLRENIYLTERCDDQHIESCDTERELTITEIVDSKEKMLVLAVDEPKEIFDHDDLFTESNVPNISTLDSAKEIDTYGGNIMEGEKSEVVPLTKLIPATPTSHNLPVSDEPTSPAASESSSSSIISLTYPCHSIPLVALTKAMTKEDEEEQLISVDAAVASLEDLEISPARRLESPNQPIFFDMEDDSSFQEWDSDSSDDFCIIEPSHSSFCREDYEALPGEDHELLQSTLSLDQGRTNEPLANSTGFTYHQTTTLVSTTTTDVQMDAAVSEEEEELLVEPFSAGQDQDVEAAESVHSIQEDNLVHKMNEEERIRYKLLLQAEIFEEQLKKKELEKAQKVELERAQREQEAERVRREEEMERVQTEQEVKSILEAKEREAAFINENLERAAKQKESVDQKTTASLIYSHSTEETVSKRDVDCQANLEFVHPASHIIQNVASGVSKAATTAYYTAKDVFYSLQAKQNEWKAPSSTYKPPQSGWTPPNDNYIPPTSKWTPPQSQFVLPPSCLENSDAADGQAEGARVDDASTTGKRLSSGGSHPVTLMEGSDSELTRELKAMQHLIEMGFANREQNRLLLNKFDGDLEKVVQCLLQEEGETGEHWAIHRH